MDYPQDLLEIVVFDNGSTDGTVEWLEKQDIRVIANDTNIFFAPAVNRAVEVASGEVVALLNNDMRVDPGWLRSMTEDLSRGVDCVASKILNWDGTFCQFAGGGINMLAQGFEHGCPIDQITPERKEILFACGGAMLISKNLFLDAGGFDEDYELLYEDVDLGWRLNLMGYKVCLCPQATVYHRSHASVSKMRVLERVRILERNALFTLIKNYEEASLEKILPLALSLAEERAALFSLKEERGFFSTLLHHLTSRNELRHKGESIAAALAEVFSNFENLLKKRSNIQAKRSINDVAIFELFGDPFRVWAYEEDDYLLLADAGYSDRMKQKLQEMAQTMGFPVDPA